MVMPMLSSNPKIVVIGAGLAGLTTAYRLQQNGADVEVYEAHQRVGGRIFTVVANGHLVELGGQNISDGGEAENIHRLLTEFNLETVQNKVVLDLSYYDGKKFISKDEIMRGREFDPDALKKTLDALAPRSKNIREILDALLKPDDPLYRLITTQMAVFEGGTVDKLSPLYVDTLYTMLMGGFAPVHETQGEKEHYIHLLFLKDGNSRLTEKLASLVPIHLNKALTSLSKTNKKYTLQFQDGEIVEADIVVLAIPCTTYQNIDFGNGVIPSDTLHAIQNIHYGMNSKIVVPFEHIPSNTKAIVTDHMSAFYTFDRDFLTIYYVKENSRFKAETIESTYLHEKPLLERYFPGIYPSHLPLTYARDEPFASYPGLVGYSWTTDPYFQGSYSFIGAGQEALLTCTTSYQGETVRTLFTPINHSLYFTGEHTSILFDVPGTMEAACESGERTARLILTGITPGRRAF